MPTTKKQHAKSDRNGNVTESVRRILSDRPGEVWRASEVSERLGISKAHATAVLARMVKVGELSRLKHGVYGQYRSAAANGTAWSEVASMEPDRILVRRNDGTLWVAAPAVIEAAGL